MWSPNRVTGTPNEKTPRSCRALQYPASSTNTRSTSSFVLPEHASGPNEIKNLERVMVTTLHLSRSALGSESRSLAISESSLASCSRSLSSARAATSPSKNLERSRS